jgi:CHASE3 domain sensor protein
LKRTMKIRTRIILGFTGVLAVMMIIIGIIIYNMSRINVRIEDIIAENNVKLELAYDLRDYFRQIREEILKVVSISDDVIIEQEADKLKSFRVSYKQVYESIVEMPVNSEEEKALRDKIEELVAVAVPINNNLFELGMMHKNTEAIDVMLNQADPATEELIRGVEDYIKLIKKDNSEENLAATNAFHSSIVLLIVLGIIGLIYGIVAAYYVTDKVNKMVNKIANSLNDSAGQVAAASSQLSATAGQLSQGSAEQAGAIEETSSTLQETTSMLEQNTANTIQAAHLSEQAKESADRGNAEMQEMLTSIREIKQSSDQISKIIKVIDDIAFQTNILALNAAIEAARAGEAGMGFAVVAEEVRNLAGRSAQAAKDTTAIIEANIELSDTGVSMAEKVRQALTDITNQAKKVSELMGEIVAASQEQAEGINQVNKAMTQMETVTQQNAANAEESASAAEQLNAQADNMRSIVQDLVRLVDDKSAELHHSELIMINDTSYPDTKHAGQMLPDRKTKVISPENVIPLEDDHQNF